MKESRFLLVIFVALLMMSCGKAKLQLAVLAANAECPTDAEDGMTLESVEMDGNTVVFHIGDNETLDELMDLPEMLPLYKEAMMGMLQTGDEDIKEMVDLVVNANASMRFIIKGKRTGHVVDVFLTADEIKSRSKGQTISEDQLLDSMDPVNYVKGAVAAANSKCPTPVGQHATLNSVELKGTTVIYTFTIEDSNIDMNQLRQNIDMLKSDTMEELMESSDLGQFAAKCAEAGFRITYNYIGADTNERVSFTISNAELKNNFQ